ncbi:hypothetical protein GCM10010404_45150 [Nonomuraea africana]|uniref:Lipoprotein n=1 Tax=Nonomuraea africana TaxID=46171 RepID=A0ABR9KHQ1_9ACTN|nr:hypothetical protein [Nonomuraea africana]MBE1561544.1 hypothetical protein [Nonomuraea africana]
MKRRAHAVFGVVALVLISAFMVASLVVEAVGDEKAVAGVKAAIALGACALVFSMIATGGTGTSLAGKDARGLRARLIEVKRRRMAVVAGIGLLVLVPCAVTLWRLSAEGAFGTAFYAIQAVEFAGGAVNLVLVGLNLRDGLRMTGRIRRPQLQGISGER